jgi:hypothetical protein
MNNSLESELANLLNDLLAVQEELLATLVSKRELLMARDTEGLAAIGLREEKLMGDLTECLKRREALLGEARQQGLPSGSIRSLAEPRSRPSKKESSFCTMASTSTPRPNSRWPCLCVGAGASLISSRMYPGVLTLAIFWPTTCMAIWFACKAFAAIRMELKRDITRPA